MKPKFTAQKKNRDNMLLLLSHPPFEEEVARIRDSLWIKRAAVGEFEDPETLERRFGLKEHRMLAREIKRLMDEYNLPENYASHLREHILYGKMNAPLNNFAVTPFFPGIDSTWPNHVTIEVYARLTKEEWADLKREVDRLGNNLPAFKALADIEKKVAAEKAGRSAQEYNHDPNREYRATYREAIPGRSPKKTRENIREVKDLRKKRFGREKQGPFLP